MTAQKGRNRRVAIIAASTLIAASVLTYGEQSTPSVAHADAGATVTLQWQEQMSSGAVQGSAGVATLDGQGTSLVIGDSSGAIYAYHASDGSTVSGWPYQADSGVYSTPAVSGTGSSARVYVGVGVSGHYWHNGGYLALNSTGDKVWEARVYALLGGKGGTRGVMSSLAVGPIQTSMDVVGGAMSQVQLAMNASNGHTLPGFPWLGADTNFSSPALADLSGTGHDFIIEGGDSTAGVADYQTYSNGGHIRIIRPSGYQGSAYPNGGLHCQYNTTQVVQSAPAVGNFLGSGTSLGIVVGTGGFYHGASDSNQLIAIDTNCHLVWKHKLDGNSLPSPALADVDGNPVTTPDVVTESGAGTLYVLNGATGAQRWSIPFGGGARGTVTTFQSPTGNFQYIVVPTGNGVYLVNGQTHQYSQISYYGTGDAVTVDADPDGRIGLTVVGYGGQVLHYTLDGTYNVSTVETPGAWPMFHHDPQLDGFVSDLPPSPLKSQQKTNTPTGVSQGRNDGPLPR